MRVLHSELRLGLSGEVPSLPVRFLSDERSEGKLSQSAVFTTKYQLQALLHSTTASVLQPANTNITSEWSTLRTSERHSLTVRPGCLTWEDMSRQWN